MFLKISGDSTDDDYWINTDLVVGIRYDSGEHKFVIEMTGNLRKEVYRREAMARVDAFLGCEPHEVSNIYG